MSSKKEKQRIRDLENVWDTFTYKVNFLLPELVNLYCGDTSEMPEVRPVTLWKVINCPLGEKVPLKIRETWQGLTLPACCNHYFPFGMDCGNSVVPSDWGIFLLKIKNPEAAEWFEINWKSEAMIFDKKCLQFVNYGLAFLFFEKEKLSNLILGEYPRLISDFLIKPDIFTMKYGD